ncbi:MAG: phosphate/phosphite/phosphonate ABC transporter substrate-binding protein [Proteobacteria bacterium]|nr:phosphate/phosphite/phosphonate ABC transporter substrate-binding protein [Pseudomonadota bacterium]MBU1686936.1 phosphate/phosphite/phosphonate ABC transporter substrate-binding protein [Pseudomonadota bacterium]
MLHGKCFTRSITLIALFLAGLFLFQPSPTLAAQDTILIGLIPEMNIFKQKKRFQQLGDYLSQKTGVKVEFTILSRYGNIIESFTTEKMDGAFFGSFTGALAIQKLGVIPLARPVNLDGSSTYHGFLIVRKDSGIKTVEDMRGKRMAFVEKATTAGYIFPRAYFKEHGVSVDEGFFSETFFTGSHDSAIMAVLDHKADVGAAKHSIYNRLQRENPRIDQELLILADSPKVPSNGLCVRPDLDPDLREKFKQALLGLETDPAGKSVLDDFGALRFIETTAGDYQPVFEMAEKAGIDIKKYDYLNE